MRDLVMWASLTFLACSSALAELIMSSETILVPK